MSLLRKAILVIGYAGVMYAVGSIAVIGQHTSDRTLVVGLLGCLTVITVVWWPE